MGSLEGSVEDLARAILAEARDETEQLKLDARTKVDAIHQSAQAEAGRERKVILDQAIQEADRLRGQARATAQLKARSMQLERRERMLEKVFRAVSEQLPAVVRRKDYQELVANLVREGLGQLRADGVQVRADQDTLKVLSASMVDEISRSAKTKIAIGKPLEHGTGVVLEAAEGRLQFDNTLETRLARIQSAVRAEVYRILVGETV
jgi:vacuolar-type H+-ATPase subunit E/Vma4